MLSSIGSTIAGGISSSIAQARSQMVDRIFKKVDSNQDGKITKSELAQSLKSDSVNTDSSGRGISVDELYKQLDTGNKGYITRQDAAIKPDAAARLDKLEQAQPGAVAGGVTSGGASEPGGATGAKGAKGGGGGAAIVVTDPKDTNQDGRVSMQEELAYVVKQYNPTVSRQQSQSVPYA